MKNRIALYIANTSELRDKEKFQKVYDMVSRDRQNKVNSFRFMKDKTLSLMAEYLLICACLDFGIDYKEVSIAYKENGKPYFKDLDIYFNLSHSEEIAICAISDFPVGCDVEKIMLTDEYDEEFYKGWTKKESYLKCTGEGLGNDNISKPIQIIDREFVVYDFTFNDGYQYALCIKNTEGGEDLGQNSKDRVSIHRKTIS